MYSQDKYSRTNEMNMTTSTFPNPRFTNEDRSELMKKYNELSQDFYVEDDQFNNEK